VVSAICGLLSLVLLYPSGPMVGIVLFVIGTGIWVGVQHLGYHEFIELGRVAHRMMEQKKIIVNNPAICRARRCRNRRIPTPSGVCFERRLRRTTSTASS
jgi:hypothetical protein